MLKMLFKQLRPHQWTKNFFLFIPILAAHVWDSPAAWIRVSMAFVVFSFLASSVYILNDFCDLKSDRLNPLKKHRPMASGRLKISHAFAMGAVLLTVAALLSWKFLDAPFWFFCAAYLLINVAYSFKLKRIHSADVLCLAFLYTLRIFAGGAAAGVPVSFWLLTFSSFFFLGLAFVKRLVELMRVAEGTKTGRDYVFSDVQVLMILGVASSFASLLVLALYLNSSDVQTLYKKPNLLWFVTLIATYWLTRLWVLASRKQVDDDPVLFALKDFQTWLVALVGLGCLWLAL